MLQILILILFICLYILIQLKRIKLNKYTSIVLVVSVTVLTMIALRPSGSNFKKINQIDQIKLITHLKPKSRTNIISPNDVVTDQENLYSIIKEQVIIHDVNTLNEKMRIKFAPEFKPMSLVLANEQLIVLGEISDHITEILFYNLDNYHLLKQVKIEAKYVKSKVINNNFYLVTSSQISNPKQKQSYYLNNKEFVIDDLYHLNNTYTNNFINIMKISLTNKEVKAMSYLGLGYTVYFSDSNLYIAEELINNELNQSIIIKIDLEKIKIIKTQEIKGFVLNEYSMNEYNNQLRVASTESYDNFKTNHLYILNNQLQIEGLIDNISIGKEIQSVVFMENKAIIETFNVGNLTYLIDLKEKSIISETVLEGYDTYLMPYDEKYLIGLGLIVGDDFNPIGLKVSLYKVDHVIKLISQNTIMYKDYLDAFTPSLYDPKSLLIDKENNLLAFPVEYWLGSKPDRYKQSYFVYQMNLTQGFKKMGTITHYPSNNHNIDNNYDIKNGLIINKKLYTISNNQINLHNLKLTLLNQRVIG